MDKDPHAKLQEVAGRMPLPGQDPSASTKSGPRLPDAADDPPPRDEAESASTGDSEPKPSDARQQILALKTQAEELRTVGHKWQQAAQAALAAERQLTAFESDLGKARSERDDALAKAAAAQALADTAKNRSAALEADLEKVRGERDGALAKEAEAEATADEAKKRSAALEADFEKVRGERDGALAKAEATAGEAKKRSAALAAGLEKARGERDGALARVEAVERAREAEATGTRASWQELVVNGIVALIFIAGLLLLLILKS